MRFYTESHQYYCGIDLHARNLYMCVVDREGEKRFHKRLPNSAEQFLSSLKPFEPDVVVAVESTYNWYWLADLCSVEGIEFVLGHALYMRAIHQGKTKNDRMDSEKIARLAAGKMFPQSYAYPRAWRETRDLLRRRLYFVRERAALKGHIEIVNSQYNLPALHGAANYKSKRSGIVEHFPEDDLKCSAAADIMAIERLDEVIKMLEQHIAKKMAEHDNKGAQLLQTIPGIGKILSQTFLYELHTVNRFADCQDFVSYSRLAKGDCTSDGKNVNGGSKGRKMGNPYLKWAFSEGAVQMARTNQRVSDYCERLKRKHKTAGAYSRLSAKLGRTVYHMLKHRVPFDEQRFFGV